MVITTRNPATDAHLADYPELDDHDLENALANSAAAFADWRRSPLTERTALLAAIADMLDANRDRLARQISLEMGKTHAAALAEVEKSATPFRYYAEHGPALLADQPIAAAQGGKARVRPLPLGPVLAIMPWNFPIWQVVRFLAPAIMAGNAALLKHASITMGCAEMLEKLVRDAGAPSGLFQNLVIRAPRVEQVLTDPRIVAATLTGSEAAGSAVAATAGRLLKKTVLELGGSDPFIVMPSADIASAAATAVKARINNAGQSCICAKRIIVHADCYDAFMDHFVPAMQAVRVGDPFDPASDIGPLSSHAQRESVLDQMARIRQAGGTILFGGEKIGDKGAFFSPAIVTGLASNHPVAREEIFGPVATVYRADGIDDAIALANDTPFGLGSSVWTQDAGEQERFINEIEAGMTALNAMLASTAEAPFGGVKRSGHGRELGPWGLYEFMNLKAVMA